MVIRIGQSQLLYFVKPRMPIVQYSQSRPCNIGNLPFTNITDIQQYFSINDVNLKIRKHSKISYPTNIILNSINKNQSKNWQGLTLFNDYEFLPWEMGPDWRYYVCKFPKSKQITQLSKIHSIATVLNVLKSVLPLILRSMAIYTQENNMDLIIRSIIDVELTAVSLKQCHNNQIVPKGFSKIIHYRVIERETEFMVTVGYTQSYLQFIYLLLQFREVNFRRFNLNAEITLVTLDNVIQHLIQIMRKMAKTHDYNLYGKGVKAVFETYLLEERFSNSQKIKERMEEHKRLLLLYECQYARISVYNATVMGNLEDIIQKKDMFYHYLSTVLLNSQGLTLDDDLSYCCYMEKNEEAQELTTIIAVEKKTGEMKGSIPIDKLIETGVNQLIRFFQAFPEFSQSLVKSPSFERAHQSESPHKFINIKPNFKYLQMNKSIMMSKIKREDDELVAFVPKIASPHFFKEYKRLKTILSQDRKNAEYVEGVISQIIKLHKQKMSKYLSNPKMGKSPQKRSLNISKTSTAASLSTNNSFQLSLAKSIKIITEREYNILNLIERAKNNQESIISILIEHNPFINQRILCGITQEITQKHLKNIFNSFLNKNSLEPVRQSVLYKYLSSVSRVYNSRYLIDFEELNIDEELLELIEPKTSRSESDAYYSLLGKVTALIFKPNTNNNRLLNTLFKILEEYLLKISSTQQMVYVLLGGLYLEVLIGGMNQPLTYLDKPGASMTNNPYKNSNVSELTNNIKRDKILEFISAKGVQAETMTIQNFFESVKKTPSHGGQIPYQIYKDFVFSNYDLHFLIQQVYKNPTSTDLNPIHKQFIDYNFKDKIPVKGTTVFSLFSSDIQSYSLPSTEEDFITNKSQLFNKTLSTSRFVKDLYHRNPDAKLAGVTMKQVFTEVKEVEVDLYNKNTIAQRVYGITLIQAQQYFNLFMNLDYKYNNYERLTQDQKLFFNETVQKILAQQSKLKQYVERTIALELYLKKLERE